MGTIFSPHLLGLICEVQKDFTISEKLLEFLNKDNQGIDGIEFMIKNYKLSLRIPPDVRSDYEKIRAQALNDLNEALEKTISELTDLFNDEEAKKQVILHFLQKKYEEQVEKN